MTTRAYVSEWAKEKKDIIFGFTADYTNPEYVVVIYKLTTGERVGFKIKTGL